MFNIGPVELAIIFVLVLLVFGPKRLPEISRAMGKGMKMLRDATREVRGSMADLQAEVEREIREAERAKDDFKKTLLEDEDTRSDSADAEFSAYDPAAEDYEQPQTAESPYGEEDEVEEPADNEPRWGQDSDEEESEEEKKRKAPDDNEPDDSSNLAG
jgi:TatA/E family protein of Tat protein translocase